MERRDGCVPEFSFFFCFVSWHFVCLRFSMTQLMQWMKEAIDTVSILHACHNANSDS
jgi:hypothetical protein